MVWNIFNWFRSSKKETSSEKDKKGFKLSVNKSKINKNIPFAGKVVDEIGFNEKKIKTDLLNYMKSSKEVNRKENFVNEVVEVLNTVVESRNQDEEQNKTTGLSKMLKALEKLDTDEKIKILSSGRVSGKSLIGWFSFWDSSMQKAFSNKVKNLDDITSEVKTGENKQNITSAKKSQNQSNNKNNVKENEGKNSSNSKIELIKEDKEIKNEQKNDESNDSKVKDTNEDNDKKNDNEKKEIEIQNDEKTEINGNKSDVNIIKEENSINESKEENKSELKEEKKEEIEVEEKKSNDNEEKQKSNDNEKNEIVLKVEKDKKDPSEYLEQFKNDLDNELKKQKNLSFDGLTEKICEKMVKIPKDEKKEIMTIYKKNKEKIKYYFQKIYQSRFDKKTFGPNARFKKQDLIQNLTNALFSGDIKETLERLRIYKNGKLQANDKLEMWEKDKNNKNKEIVEIKVEQESESDASKENDKNDIKEDLNESKVNKTESNDNSAEENGDKVNLGNSEVNDNNNAEKKDDAEKYSSIMSSENWINNIKASVEKNAKQAASYDVRDQKRVGYTGGSYWYADQLLFGLCKSLINAKENGDKDGLVRFVIAYDKNPTDLGNAIVELFKQIFSMKYGFYYSYAMYWSYNNYENSDAYAKVYPGYEDKLINYEYKKDYSSNGGTINYIDTIAKALTKAANSKDFEGNLKKTILNSSGDDVNEKYKSTSYRKK